MTSRRSHITATSSRGLDPPVIIEFGSAIIRCGYVGEATPRHTIPSPLSVLMEAKPVDSFTRQSNELNDTIQIKKERTSWIPNHSCQFMQQEYEVVLEPLIERIFVDLLLCHKIRSRRVIIIEHLFSVKPLREAIAKVLFESRGVPSVMFLVDVACPTFALPPSSPRSSSLSQLSTNIVLDIGNLEARSVLVCNGNPFIDTFQCASLGHASLAEELRTKLEEDVRLSLTLADASFVLDFVTENVLGGVNGTKMLMESNESDTQFHGVCIPSTGKHERIPLNAVRFIWDEAIKTISMLLLKSILASPIDLRRIATSNIVPVGGGTMVTGLCDRIEGFDLSQHFGSKVPASYKSSLSKMKFDFAQQMFPRKDVNWIGASIFGTTHFDEGKWLNQEEWSLHREKSLVDWLSISRQEKKAF